MAFQKGATKARYFKETADGSCRALLLDQKPKGGPVMKSQAYWLFNTDETEDEGEGAYQKMIDQSCIAAWGNCRNQGAKKTLQKPRTGETLFFFCARRGIIASGQVKDGQPFRATSVFGGEADREYHRAISEREGHFRGPAGHLKQRPPAPSSIGIHSFRPRGTTRAVRWIHDGSRV